MQSNTTITASESCSSGNAMECSTDSQSGMTLEHLMAMNGVVESMWCPPAFLVSLSVLPESDLPLVIHATDGRTPFASLTKSNHRGFCWRMCRDFFREIITTSEKYSATWPRAGLMQGGVCFRLRHVARRITAIDSLLLAGPQSDGTWPTPNAQKPPIRDWWNPKSDVDRVVDGVADELDRNRVIGNGQVPAVVVSAWKALTRPV